MRFVYLAIGFGIIGFVIGLVIGVLAVEDQARRRQAQLDKDYETWHGVEN